MLIPGEKYKVLKGQTYHHKDEHAVWIAARTGDIIIATTCGTIECLNTHRDGIVSQVITLEEYQDYILKRVSKRAKTTAEKLGVTKKEIQNG